MSARSPNIAPDSVETLVDAFLAEQRQLTAVERFSQRHADARAPLLEPHYRELIPLSKPRPGEQYAFEVDLDRCSSCKACVSACHSLNGLDEGEVWRDVGLLVGREWKGPPVAPVSPAPAAAPLALTVTTACHHCHEPGCLEGCPVLAYDKDPATGIVRHLDDQCIGCSYCILKCPYDVPKYSAKRGIVRKCDLCHGRLAEGEAPACVQACPNEAIRITLVPATKAPGKPAGFELPGAPDPTITKPTTIYRSTRPLDGLRPADEAWIRPAEAHLPLVWMLVLTQWGAGLLGAAALGVLLNLAERASWLPLALAGLVLLKAGLVASVFHLGQPLKAWRVWMGWRTSWLSREAMALGALAGIAVAWTMALVVADRVAWVPEILLRAGAVVMLVAMAGAVGAQAMVYIETHRQFWDREETLPRFVGAWLLALSCGLLLGASGWLPAVLVVVLAVSAGLHERRVLSHDTTAARSALARTAWLLRGPLAAPWAWRGRLMALGLAAVLASLWIGWIAALFGSVLLLAGSWFERKLFFVAVSPDQMPGAPGGRYTPHSFPTP